MTKERDESGAIVCLGLALLPGGAISPVLQRRCDKAAQIHRQFNCPIITTGGDPAQVGITEARAMSKYLIEEHGVGVENIIEESASRSTSENAVNVLKTLEAIGVTKGRGKYGGISKLYLVTSQYHMVRSLYIFQAVFNHYNCGIEVIAEESFDPVKEMKKLIKKEKMKVEHHLLNCSVMGRLSGQNIALPDKRVLTRALSRIKEHLLEPEP